jgi:hypothetical protein
MNELQVKLSELGEGLKAEYKASRKAAMWAAVEKAKPVIDGKMKYMDAFGTYKPYWMKPSTDILKRVFKNSAEVTGKGPMSMANFLMYVGDEAAEAAIEKEAEYQTRMMFEAFVSKNLAKLSGLMGEGSELLTVFGKLNAGLTGYMNFELVDGRAFDMSFSVVTKVSSKGHWFQQFPTRFHNVILADGSKMKTPSEAKMKKEF